MQCPAVFRVLFCGPAAGTGGHDRAENELAARSLTGRQVFVGSRCRISASAELKDDVVISDDVVIDRRVTLKSAVIMPNTYIGEFLEVNDAIVQGNTLIHIATMEARRM